MFLNQLIQIELQNIFNCNLLKLSVISFRYIIRMQKSFLKYYFKAITLILLVSFVLSNVSLCYSLVENCRSEMMSRSCCSKKTSDASGTVNFNKKCCCQIKESINQPFEATQSLTETSQKYPVHFSKNYSDAYIINSKSVTLNIRVMSFHSPPKEDIHILNSNLRI